MTPAVPQKLTLARMENDRTISFAGVGKNPPLVIKVILLYRSAAGDCHIFDDSLAKSGSGKWEIVKPLRTFNAVACHEVALDTLPAPLIRTSFQTSSERLS